jgi:hypothetical protein
MPMGDRPNPKCRIPKSEGNPKPEIRELRDLAGWLLGWVGVNSGFGFRISFGFRLSVFGFHIGTSWPSAL